MEHLDILPVSEYSHTNVSVLRATSVHLVYPHVATIPKIKGRRGCAGLEIVRHCVSEAMQFKSLLCLSRDFDVHWPYSFVLPPVRLV
jgi:hypothetical protein